MKENFNVPLLLQILIQILSLPSKIKSFEKGDPFSLLRNSKNRPSNIFYKNYRNKHGNIPFDTSSFTS